MGNDLPTNVYSLELSSKEQIDRICLAFEKAWRSGARPQVEAYLGDTVGPLQSALLTELLLLDLDYRRRLGEQPSAKEYRARFPRHDNVIDVVFRRSDFLVPGSKVRYFGDYELLEEIAQEGWGWFTRRGRSVSTASLRRR